jgi:hypothetical protein
MSKQALEGRRLNGFWMRPEDLVIVGLDTKHKKGEHPLWDERINLPLDENMVLNIMAEGVHEPVIVRKDGEQPLLVNGRQRVRHAREANKRLTAAGKEPVEIKTVVERGSDDRMFGIMISTNEVRREDALESKLSKLERYMAMGKSEEQAAIVFGVGVPTIKTWLAIVEAGPEVKSAIRDGALSATAAAKIAKAPREKQAALVQEVRDAAPTNGKRLTAVEIDRHVKNSKAKESPEGDKADKIVHEKPGAKLVRDIIAECADAPSSSPLGGSSDYERGFVEALKWLRGELAAERVKGLKHLIRTVSGEKKEAF